MAIGYGRRRRGRVVNFSSDGEVLVPIGSGDDVALDCVLQPDGKLVLAGFSPNDTHDHMVVVRLNPDGTPDATFGGTDTVMMDTGPLWSPRVTATARLMSRSSRS